ncbi:MAG: hypothetical protein A3F16_03055 [Deltaproteobacteria bacterium RIFCSPHIGHO2_12_FULL_43_9]|nr:MAG: hypothetical protein A3F16_03055 [Deltaproteobacteria bacterium RIFCSPHIGHO2_12_FULL_43_9]
MLFLIALIMGVAIPGVQSQYRYYIRTTSRELAATFSYLYDTAILTQRTYRVAYDLDENKYWIESAAGEMLLAPTPEAEEKKIEAELEKKKGEEETTGPQFIRETGKLAKERKLGKGVTFRDVVLKRFREPINAGIAYTYILPQGYIEETWVHIEDKRNQVYTIKVNSLTGRTNIYPRLVQPGENER